MLSWQCQSTAPRSHHHKSLQRQAPCGLQPQIGQCHTQSSTTPRYRIHKHYQVLPHNQCQYYPPPQYTQTWSRSSTPQSYEPTNLPSPSKLEPGQIPERASDPPSGSMVNIINIISGGSNEPVHETKRHRKEYYRTVSHASEGKHFRTP